MPSDRRWTDADRELVADVLHQEGCEDPCSGNCANDAEAVLDALADAGWRKAVKPGCICPLAGVFVQPDCGPCNVPWKPKDATDAC